MATIKARRQANGSIRYTAIVRKRVGKSIVHREAKTFTHRSAALSWARQQEVELERPEALRQKQAGTVTLAELIGWYGAGPATVINDLVRIGVVLRAAQTVRDLPVRPEAVQEARDACSQLRLIGKARKRSGPANRRLIISVGGPKIYINIVYPR